MVYGLNTLTNAILFKLEITSLIHITQTNNYYLNYIEIISEEKESEEVVKMTSHPEMMDENGNPIPFQIAKLISVEFDERDAFTRDPFTDLDD